MIIRSRLHHDPEAIETIAIGDGSDHASRVFKDLRYRTQKTWSRGRRVVAKAEHLSKGANPRFVVTSLCAKEFEKRYLYEELYCARGGMGNRIKEV